MKQNRGQGTPGAADQPAKDKKQNEKKGLKHADTSKLTISSNKS
jgi:hypothetical protein